MKVNISIVGRFHGFDLAKQLQKNGFLNILNTTYPRFIAKRWGIRELNIKSNIFLEFLRRYIIKYVPQIFRNKIANYINKKHALSNIKYLNKTNVFIGWSGSSLECLIHLKNKNKNKIITILERGSSHYSFQMKILSEEYSKFNKIFPINYKTWQRELLEYELADYISVPSNFVKKSFIENGIPKSKLLLNPYGVDLSNFKQVKKNDDIFRIVFAGGFNIRKGCAYLLQAFYELNLQNSELIHLGNVDEVMIDIINKYKKNNIRFLGNKPQKELYKYYSQGSVFILMSLEEGLSMVLPQAMACGLPIICSPNTGGEDLVTENGKEGFVVPIRDVKALKEKIKFLYDNPHELKIMSKNALNRVKSDFSWDDYGNRYVENLKKI